MRRRMKLRRVVRVLKSWPAIAGITVRLAFGFSVKRVQCKTLYLAKESSMYHRPEIAWSSTRFIYAGTRLLRPSTHLIPQSYLFFHQDAEDLPRAMTLGTALSGSGILPIREIRAL